MKPEIKKLLILNLPYLLFVWLFDKVGAAVRLSPGADASAKLLHLGDGFTAAFSSIAPSFHPADLALGIAGAVIVRLIIYTKGKNAKKYRRGTEYGSARWGGADDIKPYTDPVFENNIPLTQTERLTMNSRPKQPKYARNKNILVIGGSGSGKTRFFVKPSLMQCTSKDFPTSYIVTDPKGTLILETGKMLQRYKYRIKVLNTINFKKSMKYNPFAYLRSEKDILKLVNTIIANTIAHQRGTAGSFRLDVKGSDKAFNFCYRGEGERLFVFEAPIDLLSFLCLFKKEWQKQSYLALGGVGEKALLRFLSDRPNIKTVYLCLDSDQAGNDACSRLVELMPEGYTVHRLIPLFKDWNEVLQHRAEITAGKYLREAVYGVKEPTQEETVEIIRMSEVDTQTVEWLWEPYIPFGKVTIVQGNPGEGKTTFALRLAAACTTGRTLPNMKPLPPFNVIYQTAEDGLGDTVKPRLMEAAADLDRVLVIDEAKQELSLSDERIERAIRQTGARLIILDPIQAYMGEKADMNRANEVRPIFRRLAEVAERTGCAVILIGHLNKAAGGQSAYRGLGSIDFRAAARSVLLIGRVKREPNVRVVIHDKSSLAPEGKPVAFCLDPETGFEWIGEYDITADELLSGAGGNNATKTEQAERLILDLLADGKELASEDIVKAAAEAGISERTVQNAKRNMGGILGARRVGGQWYNFIKKKQPPEPAS